MPEIHRDGTGGRLGNVENVALAIIPELIIKIMSTSA
jgi:hypothetical protein